MGHSGGPANALHTAESCLRELEAEVVRLRGKAGA
jgi:hypothetical protein